MRELALFAGGGGGLLGSTLLKWDTKCAVEIDPYCRKVLLQRQADGYLGHFPIWDDIRTFNGIPWRGEIDVISGGFPCQDISSAGRRAGITGESSSLFFEMLRIIEEVRPKFVFAENSARLRTAGLGTVVKELGGLGYDSRWGVLGASHVGAPHERKRMWVVATDTKSKSVGVGRQPRRPIRLGKVVADTNNHRERIGTVDAEVANAQKPSKFCVENPGDWWEAQRFARVDDGLAHRMERVRTVGNGQVPRVAEIAFKILSGMLGERNQ